MSILIKDMEMPTRCWDCLLNTYGYCMASDEHSDIIPSDTPIPGWCPLVSIPPHGRLIDADALRQSIKESIDECHKWADEVEGGEMYARVSQSLGTFVECSLRVKAAPTIIPAEEGE